MKRADVLAFNVQLPGLKSPHDVVDRLHRDVATRAGLGVLAIWQRSFIPSQWSEYVIGQTLFPHPSVARKFWSEYFVLVARNGLTATQKMAWQNPGRPFTITEAMQATGATRGDRWLVDLFQKHGFRDGFYCPVGTWTVVYSHSRTKRLRLDAAMRGDLFYAAAQTAFHIDALVQRRRGPTLSKRERSVLAELTNGSRLVEIAERSGLAEQTVRVYIRRAQAKLGARTTTQAVAIAIRGMLI